MGTSGKIATRVRSYFTAAEKRARISEMLAAAVRVEAIECAHSLEAEVRELRLIAAHKPPYNRRSKFPERVHWLKLTVEAYPRLSVVRQLADDGAAYLGPFGSRRTAELAAAGRLRRRADAAVHGQAVRADPVAGLRAGRAGQLPGTLRAQDHHGGVRRSGPPSRSGRRRWPTRARW